MAQSQDIRFNIKMNLDDEHFYALPMQVPCDFDGDEQATVRYTSMREQKKNWKNFPNSEGHRRNSASRPRSAFVSLGRHLRKN